MAASIRDGNNRGGEDGRWHPDVPSRNHSPQSRDGLRLADAPFGFDRVIVRCFREDGGARSLANQVNVKVNGNKRAGVVQFLVVNMEKRRLQGGPEQACDAQNGAKCPHGVLPIYHRIMSGQFRTPFDNLTQLSGKLQTILSRIVVRQTL